MTSLIVDDGDITFVSQLYGTGVTNLFQNERRIQAMVESIVSNVVRTLILEGNATLTESDGILMIINQNNVVSGIDILVTLNTGGPHTIVAGGSTTFLISGGVARVVLV